MKLRYFALSLTSLALLLSEGCTSIMTHAGPYQGVYPGVKTNAERLKEGNMGWAMTPLLILDMPFSAVGDTLLLPYDAYRAGKNPAEASPAERVKQAEKQRQAEGQLPKK